MYIESKFRISQIETSLDSGRGYPNRTPYQVEEELKLMDGFKYCQSQIEELFESASLCTQQLICDQFLGNDPAEKRIVALAGRGFIGDIALRTANDLASRGADVVVLTTAEDVYQKPQHRHWISQLRTHGASVTVGQRSNVATLEQLGALDVDLILDGLLGGSPHISPVGSTANLIDWANDDFAPILSLCAPSGLYAKDCMINPTITEATATLTFIPPKPYLLTEEAADYVGDLYLGDLTIPLQDYTPQLVRAFTQRLTQDESAMALRE